LPVDPVTAPATDTERFWDGEAEGYDAAHDRDTSGRNPLRIRMAVVMRLLGPQPRRVLDCGMGPGRLLFELERLGWEIAGIDVSGEMVALARDRLQTGADRLRQGSIESLPFETGSFDAAVATGVLEYVEDVPRALAEVERILRPGGLFVIGMPNTQALGTLWRHRVVYPLVRAIKRRLRFGRPVPLQRAGWLSLSRLDKLLAAAELELERVEYIVLLPALLHSLSPSLAASVAKRLEALGPVLGTHLVAVARKPGSVGPEAPDQAEEIRAAS
jgi:ubiquinone/menaquinone biosynthesis C-methylase UbiE